MASSENLTTIEPWLLRPSLADSWLADYISRDADTLTMALQKSLAGATPPPPPPDSVSPFTNLAKSDPSPTTPTVSSLSGSDQESAPKRQRSASAAAGPTGKISKRKSRASKRSQTTFITADAANFRQMVQQVTGVRFGGSQMPMAPVLKPEPQRAPGVIGGGRLTPATGSGCLPTLDTSAYLLDHQMVGPNAVGSVNGPISGPGPLTFTQPIGTLDATSATAAAAAAAASFASAGLDFDTFSSFPTLESWKVM